VNGQVGRKAALLGRHGHDSGRHQTQRNSGKRWIFHGTTPKFKV
jgi:hypothetical protein